MIKYLDEDVQVSSASSLPKLEIPQEYQEYQEYQEKDLNAPPDDKYMLRKLSRVEGDTWASTPPPTFSTKCFSYEAVKNFNSVTYFSNDIKLPSLSWVRIIITKNQLLCPGKRLRILLFSKQKTTRF